MAIGGTATGLAGSGLVLQDNGTDVLAVSASGSFTFAKKLAPGSKYAVTVEQQPVTPSQTCTVTNGSGTATADVADVTVACSTNTYAIGGTVTGLSGSGLVLEDDGGDDLPVTGDGAFTFATPVASGATFAVMVSAQPSGPTQTCTVSGGSGTVGGADVTSVSIDCSTNTYAIAGTVTGLSGTGLVLQDDGGDDLAVSADGSFAFATPLASGATFTVTVKAQPSSPTQTCTVGMGTGTVVASDVTTVSVGCSTDTFAVGGTVSGLAGTGLVLQDNLGDDLPVSSDGAFSFATAVASGATYGVTVLTQPSSPSQTCGVTSGNGLVTSADIADVVVTCTTNTYIIGGTVTGLSGSGLVLQDEGGDDLAVGSDGVFTFATAVASGAAYGVTVLTQPSSPNQTCAVSAGSGTVTNADVTSVGVTCTTNPVTYSADAQPIFQAYCSPCHNGGGAGGTNFASTYADTQRQSTVCPGYTVGYCTLVRVMDGSMPLGAGCTGNPTTDAGNSLCLTAAEQATLQAWIGQGQLP